MVLSPVEFKAVISERLLVHSIRLMMTAIISGVFKFEGPRGVGCELGLGHLHRKKNHFSAQNDKSGCTLAQFLTDRKHGQSLEKKPWNMDFAVQSRNEPYNNSAKIIKKWLSDQRGRTIAPLPPLSHWQ